jgi:hypothetical protein
VRVYGNKLFNCKLLTVDGVGTVLFDVCFNQRFFKYMAWGVLAERTIVARAILEEIHTTLGRDDRLLSRFTRN